MVDAPVRPKPLPTITDFNRPFWEGAQEGKLRLQQCDDCDHYRYPISDYCPRCLSDQATWRSLSGNGEVFSTIVFHQVYHPAFKNDVPYNVSLIQLEEGPRLFSNVIGIPPDQVKVGDKVKAVFDKIDDTVTLPRFSPS